MNNLFNKIPTKKILLSIILLKQGNRSFKIEKLEEGLKKCSWEYPLLKNSQEEIGKIFFNYPPSSCGDFYNPDYRLSKEGRENFQKEFDNYDPLLQSELKTIAEKVWA